MSVSKHLAAAGLVSACVLGLSAAAEAAQIVVPLYGSSASAPTLTYDLPGAVFADNGLPAGQLTATASNTTHSAARAVRGSNGLGVRACSGLDCFIESSEIDGFNGSDSITFGITNQAPGFEFILVSATFARINSLGDFEVADEAVVSFGGADYGFDIADAANGQNPGSCYGLLNATCTVDFVDLLGAGDPFFMAGESFTFSALGALDGWYIREIVWEVGLQRTATPEPAALGLLGLGLAGLGLARRRRR